jgi:hypothetical protein
VSSQKHPRTKQTRKGYTKNEPGSVQSLRLGLLASFEICLTETSVEHNPTTPRIRALPRMLTAEAYVKKESYQNL